MLVTSIKSFSHIIFKSFLLQDCFTLYHIVPSFNPFPDDKFYKLPNRKSLQTTILSLMKMGESSPKGLKTLWEKEKLLVTSNFSFSHSVFKSVLLQSRKNQGLFGKALTTLEKGGFWKHFGKRRTCW